MAGQRTFVTRFAPSPSGLLHVGHVYAAMEALALAHENGGVCRLRWENLDSARCRAEYQLRAAEDLAWLGLHFDGAPLIQSGRMDAYARACALLRDAGVLYPCFCTRREIREQAAELGRAPHGALGIVYPGTCRLMGEAEREERLARGDAHCWRLDCRRAQDLVGILEWEDLLRGMQRCVPSETGDVILARRDCPASYHLAVVVDDAEQGVTHVTRGMDLFEATHVHRTLQALLGLPVLVWRHHGLLLDESGRRLAKRDGARSIASLRAAGYTVREVIDSVLRAHARGGVWSLP